MAFTPSLITFQALTTTAYSAFAGATAVGDAVTVGTFDAQRRMFSADNQTDVPVMLVAGGKAFSVLQAGMQKIFDYGANEYVWPAGQVIKACCLSGVPSATGGSFYLGDVF